MIVDGKLIAHELKGRLKKRTSERDPRLTLGIIVAEETPAIRQFVLLKELFGKSIQVNVQVLRLGPLEHTNKHLLELILHASRKYDGLILQLPVPQQLLLDNVFNLYPLTHDVDVLGNTAYQQFKEGNLPFLPPVVGAFSEILTRNGIKLAGKNVVVVGDGKLVGAPSAIWAKRHGAVVSVANKETVDIGSITRNADIVILGVGIPGILKPDMVKEGVIILDAGSGEVAGVVQGDADQACAEKASLFTPTPGGVGPITVAKVFENLVALDDIKHPKR